MVFQFFSSDPDEIERYAFKFRWTSLHQTAEELEPLRHTYDIVGGDALDRIMEMNPLPETALLPRKDIQASYEPKEKGNQRDFFSLVKAHAKDDEKIHRLWQEVNTVPSWVDKAQIERGQKVFWRYGGPAVTALTYLSLLGGMASGKPVETLDRTGGFGAEVVRRRLLETTQHTLGVHKDLASIMPGGEGWEASVRIRLLHASVRRRIIRLAQEKPEYYDIKKYGVPINDLDSIGTTTTFCSTLIWLGFPRQGIWLRPQEIRDFLALWRYIAYLIGTPHDWLATPEQAKAMMESLMVAEYAPTKAGRVLANNIITGFEGAAPIYASRGFLNALTWWLNGKELAQDLGIQKPTLYHTALVASQCALFMLNAYLYRSIPFLDEWNIKRIRSLLYDVLVENKEKGALGYRAKFSFKWIPGHAHASTPLGEQNEKRRKESGPFKRNGVERPALIILLILFSVLGYLTYGVWNFITTARVSNKLD